MDGATGLRKRARVSRSRLTVWRGRGRRSAALPSNGRLTAPAVAEALRSPRAPFVFATGYRDTVIALESIRSAPTVRKPYAGARRAEAITSLLRSRQGR